MSHTTSIPVTELPRGQRKLVFMAGRCIVLFNIDGAVYAIDKAARTKAHRSPVASSTVRSCNVPRTGCALTLPPAAHPAAPASA